MTSITQRVLAALIFFFVGLAQGAAFTAGNLVVYRIGDGSAALGGTATAVFLDEITTSGELVQTIALPTVDSGTTQKRLTASGSATSEGLLTRSVDGACLLLTGYDAALATASVANTASASVNRVVGVVTANGALDTTTALSDFSTGNNPRSAASTNCSDIWVGGGAGGVRYATAGATTSTQISTTLTNIRQVSIASGQLYASTSSGSAIRLGTVGTGLPTADGRRSRTSRACQHRLAVLTVSSSLISPAVSLE
jgi:hypothetical protein